MSEGVEAIVANDNGTDQINGNRTGKDNEEHDGSSGGSNLSNFLWHGGSVWDAWFSCASNQVIKTKKEKS